VATNLEYEVPTWNQINDMLLAQAQKIQNQQFQPDIIIGIAKGGIIPARILSDLIETPQLAALQIAFYLDIAQPNLEPILKQPLNVAIKNKKTLIVDDIADTGKSLKLAQIHSQEQGAMEIKTATLYFKPQSITKPDFYEKQTNNWVVFPWEIKETLRKITQKSVGKRAANQEIAKLVKAGLPKQLTEKLLKTIQ
jgi:hypoxanthine phosphoribosyltransferase